MSAERESVTEERFCWHIRPFSGDLLDKTLPRGPIGWLVQQHVARCRSCQRALASLVALRNHLQRLRKADKTATLPEQRWQAINAALHSVEERPEA